MCASPIVGSNPSNFWKDSYNFAKQEIQHGLDTLKSFRNPDTLQRIIYVVVNTLEILSRNLLRPVAADLKAYLVSFSDFADFMGIFYVAKSWLFPISKETIDNKKAIKKELADQVFILSKHSQLQSQLQSQLDQSNDLLENRQPDCNNDDLADDRNTLFPKKLLINEKNVEAIVKKSLDEVTDSCHTIETYKKKIFDKLVVNLTKSDLGLTLSNAEKAKLQEIVNKVNIVIRRTSIWEILSRLSFTVVSVACTMSLATKWKLYDFGRLASKIGIVSLGRVVSLGLLAGHFFKFLDASWRKKFTKGDDYKKACTDSIVALANVALYGAVSFGASDERINYLTAIVKFYEFANNDLFRRTVNF